jgi:AbrB family looped-hinge helix DNA binding protein
MHNHGPKFLGVTRVSDKGQVVIPADARAEFELEPGDKLIVLSGPGGGLMFFKPEFFDKHLNFITKRIEDFQKINEDLSKEDTGKVEGEK